MKLLTVISLGAGVQSSVMALMASHGEITPMPEFAIFADTQSEPKAVYDWLDFLERNLNFPIYRVSSGNLANKALEIRTSKTGINYTRSSVPTFINDGQKTGLLMRQCTTDFKITPIYRYLSKHRAKRNVEQWIGISLDEAHRMKPARKSWVKNRWPLIDLRMTRSDCLDWIKKNNYPTPPRSACFMCPYHSDREWRRMKKEDSDSFSAAINWELNFQKTMAQVTKFRGKPFLHRSLQPLDRVDLSTQEERGQLNMFGNECEGMCGV